MCRKSWSLAACLIGLLFTQLALAGANPLLAQYVDGPKLTIINNSGYPANQIYLVFLTLARSDDKYHHILWSQGTFLVIDASNNTKDINGILYADYSVTLDKLSKDANGNHFFSVPKAENDTVPADKQGIYSGRLWLSFKKPFYTHVTSATAYSQPDFNNPTDPNYATAVDFYEVAIDATTFKVTGDTTNVDNVAMPLVHELTNNGTSLGRMGLDLTLAKVRQAFRADPNFQKLISDQRIYAPGHGIEMSPPLFSSNYYKDYVDYCWALWAEFTLKIKVDNIWWSGKVDKDTKKLKLTGTVDEVSEDHYIDWPPSKDIFLCDGVFNGDDKTWTINTPPFNRDKDIKNRIASALNRTVMHLPPYSDPAYPTAEPWAYPESYYQGVFLAPAIYKTNVYAKILHELAIDGSCYAYAYDDNDGKSTTISGQATDIILTINQCKSGIAPELYLLLLDQ